MGVIETIKDVLGVDERTYEYVCRDCSEQFESPTAKTADVTCPECDSTQVRSAAMTVTDDE